MGEFGLRDKVFLTIDEQISLLRSRGLKITDEEKAKEFLLYNNYYRISGYSLTLRSHDVFSSSASFQQIVDIYCFDQELRHILLRYIETIEIRIKSVYAYEFTQRHGPLGYLDPKFFTDEDTYRKIMNKVNKLKERRLPQEPYLKHFIEDLQQDIPFWAYVDLFTIYDISFMFSISDHIIQEAVAETILENQPHKEYLLGRFMHSMTIIRNLCAHGSRLYNRIFQQKPYLRKKELKLLIKDENEVVDNAHLFGFLFIMKRLLEREFFVGLKEDLKNLASKYPFVNLKYCGFPKNWVDIL